MDGCYGGGDIAGAVIGTFLATLVAVALGTFVWKRRKAKQNPLRDLVLVESGDVKGGYENIGFTDEPHPMTTTKTEDAERSRKPSTADSGKGRETAVKEGHSSGENRKSPWAHFGFLLGHNKGGSHRHSFDASSPPLDLPEEYSVALKGHDFTGLGFSVCGGLKEGITVKEVMQRGPAAESSRIHPGDRIRGLWVSFEEVVLPDAIALLGYASPYAVKLDIVKSQPMSTGTGRPDTLGRGEKVSHPSFKSSSAMDLSQVGKEDPLPITIKPTVPSKPTQLIDRASPVTIPVTMESNNVQMKSPDILDMRPSAVPRTKDKAMSTVVMEVVKIEKSKIQLAADVPDGILAHMEGVTAKELPPNLNSDPVVTEGEKTEPVPKKSKFGIHVLPDLNFGRRSSSPLSDSPKTTDEKRKTAKTELKKEEEKVRTDSATPEVVECHEKEQRPSSADSSSSKKKFHIRLFHKSKQYTLEPESEGNEDSHHPDHPKDDALEFKVRKMEDVEMEAVPVPPEPMSPAHPEPPSSDLPEKHDRSFVSKGLQSLRDFKVKVSQKLSAHDTSSGEDEAKPSTGKSRKKPKGKPKGKKQVTSEGSSEENIDGSKGIEVPPEEVKEELSSESEGEEGGKPSKPKRSTKRKAPVPPTAPAPKVSLATTTTTSGLVTTSASIEIQPPTEETMMATKLFEVTGESKRSASYGDLASHSSHPHQINQSDRATSLDLRPAPDQSNHITTTAVVNDLSCVSDQLLHPPGRSTETLSSTTSSSLETLKEPSPTTTLANWPSDHVTPGHMTSDHMSPGHVTSNQEEMPEVGISTTGSTVVSMMEEVERVARETVQEIFNQVNGMEGPLERRSRSSDKKPSRIPVPASKAGQAGQVSIVQEEPKEKNKKVLLRDDSKTRLMQTVADANNIKISPVVTSRTNQESKTLEISAKELDGVMMSHSDFLAKQAARDSPPKDTSFDNWIYVDQKHQTSSSDPASSSHEDEDDMNDSRNLSPVTFRSEAQFDTSPVEVKMSPPGGTLFSTTMSLPQKSVTHITIEPEVTSSPKKTQTSVGSIQLPSLEPTGK